MILGFLPQLPDPDARDHAAKLLLDAAKDTDPTALSGGLRQLADTLCLNETAEARAVRRYEGRYLHFLDTIGGMTRLDGMLDAPNAAILRAALAPLAAPAGGIDERTPAQRNADAMVELATMAMNSGRLPEIAGEPTQVNVMTDLDDLTRRLQAGETTRSTLNGVPVTPNTVRMLACDACIIPAVMRGPSEILDLGRTTRTWSRAQRKAAKIRAGAPCEAPGCRVSIDRCQLHHEQHWALGGTTDINNGIERDCCTDR